MTLPTQSILRRPWPGSNRGAARPRTRALPRHPPEPGPRRRAGRAVHDRVWRVRGDDLFGLVTPRETGLSPADADAELLLLPAPADGEARSDPAALWRTLFHAAADREIDRAFADGRLDEAAVQSARRDLGPAPGTRSALFSKRRT